MKKYKTLETSRLEAFLNPSKHGHRITIFDLSNKLVYSRIMAVQKALSLLNLLYCIEITSTKATDYLNTGNYTLVKELNKLHVTLPF